MQPLVRIEQHNIALLFSNYLQYVGIHAKVISVANGYDICCEERHIQQAQQLFAEFIQQPYATKYQTAAWQNNDTQVVIAQETSFFSQFRTQFLSHAGIVTLIVFALCWLVFLGSITGFAQPIYQQLHFFNDLQQSQFLTQPWRLISPVLFHFSWLHIVFNSLWWWQLAGDIERRLGKNMLLVLFLCSAIISNTAQFITAGANFGGLSGVVYALVGFIWWLGWLAPQLGVTIAKPIVGFLLVWMLLGFVQLLPVNVANAAHLYGLLCGCGLAVIYRVLFVKSPKTN